MNVSLNQVACTTAAVFTLVFAVFSRGGTETVTGKEWGLWTKDRFSVIVARVTTVKALEADAAHSVQFGATIEPLATIAGSFDPSAHGSLDVHFEVSPIIAIETVPKVGSLFLAVLVRDDYIMSQTVLFMPDGCPLTKIDGLDDKRILETLARIRDARAHGDPDLNARPPATRPSRE